MAIMAVATTTASAQGFFGGGSGGGGSGSFYYPPSLPYRAINQSPTTGRTYTTEADHLTPKVQRNRKKHEVIAVHAAQAGQRRWPHCKI